MITFIKRVSLLFLLTFSFAYSGNIELKADLGINVDFTPSIYQSGQNISGVINVSNNESYTLSNLKPRFVIYYSVPPLGEISGFNTEKLSPFGISFSNESYSLRGNESIKIPFNLTLPENLPSGEYKLEVGFIREGVFEENLTLVNIGVVEGRDNFLNASKVMALRNEEEYPGLSGISYEEGVNPLCRIDLENNFNIDLNLSPTYKTYYRFIGGEVVQEGDLEMVSIKANKTKRVDISLPSVLLPQSYITTIQFKGDGVMSSIAACRWIVRGESASIAIFKLNKNTYKEGDVAKANVFIAGAADVGAAEEDHEVTDLGDILIKIVIRDFETDEIIGEVSQKTDLYSTFSSDIEIPILAPTRHYKATLSVLKNGVVLAEEEILNEPALNNFSWNMTYTLITLGLIILSFLGIYLKKPEEELIEDNNAENNVEL